MIIILLVVVEGETPERFARVGFYADLDEGIESIGIDWDWTRCLDVLGDKLQEIFVGQGSKGILKIFVLANASQILLQRSKLSRGLLMPSLCSLR